MLERPDNGARVRFDRVEVRDDGVAVYSVRVWLPEGELSLRTELSEGSRASIFEPVAGDIATEPWLDKYLQSMARQLARAGGWPRKLVQWHSAD